MNERAEELRAGLARALERLRAAWTDPTMTDGKVRALEALVRSHRRRLRAMGLDAQRGLLIRPRKRKDSCA